VQVCTHVLDITVRVHLPLSQMSRFIWLVRAMLGERFAMMRPSDVALRLQPSILEEARRISETQGVALNQFINVAVAEKVSALRIEDYFREHGLRGKRGLTPSLRLHLRPIVIRPR
jgi:hypothetical protein